MGRVTVDIKEWVANGRFEGDKKIHNREGKSTINFVYFLHNFVLIFIFFCIVLIRLLLPSYMFFCEYSILFIDSIN